MIECYKYSAPLALGSKNVDSSDLLFLAPRFTRLDSYKLSSTSLQNTNFNPS
jgi:hypothetical protein